jgi:hypothetical protein
MDISEIDYDGLRLLSSLVAPSRYIFCPNDAAKLVSWQIAMADNTIRDVLFSEVNSRDDVYGVGSKIFFNAKSVPISGFETISIEELRFKEFAGSGYELVFVPENADGLPCRPRITYKLSELYFRVEISITNSGEMPMYWRPEIHFFVNLPWTEGTQLERYVVKNLAKKRLRVSDDLRVIGFAKCSEKISLELLNDCAIGFCQLRDSKIWIGTPNEEEGLSFIFGNKTQRSAMVMRKTETARKTGIAFFSDIPNEANISICGDVQSYTIIPPDMTDTFSAEILAY